jgi:hypothetical protein
MRQGNIALIHSTPTGESICCRVKPAIPALLPAFRGRPQQGAAPWRAPHQDQGPKRPPERVFFDKATPFVSEGLVLAVHLYGFERVVESRHRADFLSFFEEGTDADPRFRPGRAERIRPRL